MNWLTHMCIILHTGLNDRAAALLRFKSSIYYGIVVLAVVIGAIVLHASAEMQYVFRSAVLQMDGNVPYFLAKFSQVGFGLREYIPIDDPSPEKRVAICDEKGCGFCNVLTAENERVWFLKIPYTVDSLSSNLPATPTYRWRGAYEGFFRRGTGISSDYVSSLSISGVFKRSLKYPRCRLLSRGWEYVQSVVVNSDESDKGSLDGFQRLTVDFERLESTI